MENIIIACNIDILKKECKRNKLRFAKVSHTYFKYQEKKTDLVKVFNEI